MGSSRDNVCKAAVDLNSGLRSSLNFCASICRRLQGEHERWLCGQSVLSERLISCAASKPCCKAEPKAESTGSNLEFRLLLTGPILHIAHRYAHRIGVHGDPGSYDQSDGSSSIVSAQRAPQRSPGTSQLTKHRIPTTFPNSRISAFVNQTRNDFRTATLARSIAQQRAPVPNLPIGSCRRNKAYRT